MLGNQNMKTTLLEYTLFKEFTEEINTAIVIHNPKGVTKFTLNLRNKQKIMPAAALLNPMTNVNEQP